MNNFAKRIKNITGQLKGIEKMADNNRDCLEIIQQLQAVKSATEGLISVLAESEICKDDADLKLQKLIRILAK